MATVGVQIWFPANIQNNIVAQAIAMVAMHAADGRHNGEYIRGALDAYRSLAIAHGCTWPDVFAAIRADVAPAHISILDAATTPLLEAESPQER